MTNPRKRERRMPRLGNSSREQKVAHTYQVLRTLKPEGREAARGHMAWGTGSAASAARAVSDPPPLRSEDDGYGARDDGRTTGGLVVAGGGLEGQGQTATRCSRHGRRRAGSGKGVDDPAQIEAASPCESLVRARRLRAEGPSPVGQRLEDPAIVNPPSESEGVGHQNIVFMQSCSRSPGRKRRPRKNPIANSPGKLT